MCGSLRTQAEGQKAASSFGRLGRVAVLGDQGIWLAAGLQKVEEGGVACTPRVGGGSVVRSYSAVGRPGGSIE